MQIDTFNTLLIKVQSYVEKKCAKVGAKVVNTEIACDLGDLVLIFTLEQNEKQILPITTENLTYINPNARIIKLTYNNGRKVDFKTLIAK